MQDPIDIFQPYREERISAKLRKYTIAASPTKEKGNRTVMPLKEVNKGILTDNYDTGSISPRLGGRRPLERLNNNNAADTAPASLSNLSLADKIMQDITTITDKIGREKRRSFCLINEKMAALDKEQFENTVISPFGLRENRTALKGTHLPLLDDRNKTLPVARVNEDMEKVEVRKDHTGSNLASRLNWEEENRPTGDTRDKQILGIITEACKTEREKDLNHIEKVVMSSLTITLAPFLKLYEELKDSIQEVTISNTQIKENHVNMTSALQSLNERTNKEAELTQIWQSRLSDLARRDAIDKSVLMEAVLEDCKWMRSTHKHNNQRHKEDCPDTKLKEGKGPMKLKKDATNLPNQKVQQQEEVILIPSGIKETNKLNSTNLERSSFAIFAGVTPKDPNHRNGKENMSASNEKGKKPKNESLKRKVNGSRAFLRNLRTPPRRENTNCAKKSRREMSMSSHIGSEGLKDQAKELREESREDPEQQANLSDLIELMESDSEKEDWDSLSTSDWQTLDNWDTVDLTKKSKEDLKSKPPKKNAQENIREKERRPGTNEIELDSDQESIRFKTLEQKRKEMVKGGRIEKKIQNNTCLKESTDKEKKKDYEVKKRKELPLGSPLKKTILCKGYYLKLETAENGPRRVILNRRYVVELCKQALSPRTISTEDIKIVEFPKEHRLDQVILHLSSKNIKQKLLDASDTLRKRGFRLEDLDEEPRQLKEKAHTEQRKKTKKEIAVRPRSITPGVKLKKNNEKSKNEKESQEEESLSTKKNKEILKTLRFTVDNSENLKMDKNKPTKANNQGKEWAWMANALISKKKQ
ncbi:glutamic acid-rich protein-like [Ambystoma mexicanum]|uniref:glutamic acid-rich protein-like n=1 Tax=Ambystoma mexicanum TaxID=8296 RepID=UPI0037E9B2A0